VRGARLRLVGLLGLGGFLGGSAQADPEETERRLVASGTDPAFRGQIHEAIDRGVKFLVSRQRTDGSFVEEARGPLGQPAATGVTLLCALALRHAGTAEGTQALQRGLAYLFDRDPAAARSMERDVYHAGIALMLLEDVPGHDAVARKLAVALSRALDTETDWWGYGTPGAEDLDRRAGPPAFRDPIPNLSSSQFAALGLWSARRMRIAVPREVWVRHATALCASQKKNGSWQYGRGGLTAVRRPGEVNLDDEFGTVTGTYMGLANLLLAQEALRAEPDVPASLNSKVAAAVARARAALARHAPRTLADPRASIHPEDEESRRSPTFQRRLPASPGVGAYSTLFALEKACLFADVEWFPAVKTPVPPGGSRQGPNARRPRGRVSWYAAGAQWLLSVQRSDGGWAPNAGDPPGDESSEVDTAFALLFLLRSPAAFHPRTPADVDSKPPVAGGPR
jgi:hypothetical protein